MSAFGGKADMARLGHATATELDWCLSLLSRPACFRNL